MIFLCVTAARRATDWYCCCVVIPGGPGHWGDRGMKQQVVVVTGASAGVGRATAREFARRGARVGLLARGQDGLDGARHDVEALGGTPLAIPTDVAIAADVES